MGLFDTIKDKVESEVVQNAIQNQAASFMGGNSNSSSENQQQNEGGDNQQQQQQQQQSSSSSNQYVDKIESFVGEERINQIKTKVGEANFEKAEKVIEQQIESRFKN